MSGYFGVARRDGKAIDTKLLERAAAQLHFRGPDQTSVWAGAGIGGCFTLLKTGPANQAKQQPVQQQNRYLLWGDLRLDGRRELSGRLAIVGSTAGLHEEITSEDLLLQSWQRWGPECLSHIIGDYSFVVWDEQEKCLWCARDFIGARPFFYADTPQGFYFGNTLETFLTVPEISRDLDKLFIDDFLLQGFSADQERTVYRQIRRLPPGHLLKFSNGEVTVHRFSTLPVEEPLQLAKPEEYTEAYLELLRQAVRDRLPAGSTAVYLSGGLDSSAVCFIATEIAEERAQPDLLKAFTVSWQSLIADDREAEFARLTANQLRIQQIILEEPETVPFEAASTPEPTIEPFWARAQRHYGIVSTHSRVVLAGDGGDDVLTGQAWPYLLYLWQRRAWGAIAKEFGGYIIRQGRVPPLRGGFRSRITGLFGEKISEPDLPEWLSADAQNRLRQKSEVKTHPASMAETHRLHPAAHAGLHSGYWAGVLEEEDAGWTKFALESRAPMLDLRVLRFLLRLPPVPWCMNKELLRGAMKNRLPEAVLNRTKAPLSADPLEVCLSGNQWKPMPPQKPPAAMREYVDWENWLATLRAGRGSDLLQNLRPLALAQWLKGIEND
jgi:asparagine synthase (glutamine-hydrolysing)